MERMLSPGGRRPPPYFARLHDLWNRGEAPTAGEERALMARFGMETA